MRLGKGKRKSAKRLSDEEDVPEDLRCNRSDGKRWRCSRRAMDDKKFCELHHLQLRHRQHKEKVPESLKLKRRKRNRTWKKRVQNLEIEDDEKEKKSVSRPSTRSKNVEVTEELDGAQSKTKSKKGDSQLELISEFLKKKVERKKGGKQNLEPEETTELLKELPNGIMAISPPLSPNVLNNAIEPCNVKVGTESGISLRRCFRSKNIEPVPIATTQILPRPRNGDKLKKVQRKKCHWCKKSRYRSLIRCCTCKKEFFCRDCILQRSSLLEEQVKKECPVCRKTCRCRICIRNQSKEDTVKDSPRTGRNSRKVDLLYLLHMLLPVLKKINREQTLELEVEAKIKGTVCSQLQIQQAEAGCSKLYNCNYCKGSILDLHRSCKKCSYNLCLYCCSKFYQDVPSDTSKHPNKSKVGSFTHKFRSKRPNFPALSPKWKHLKGDDGSLICPPVSFDGCGDGLLDLQSIFPPSWALELQVNGENIISTYDSPQKVDDSSCCLICESTKRKGGRNRVLQTVARREDPRDNLLYYPSMKEPSDISFSHFQKHWEKGHPVIVQKVIKSAGEKNWDPLVMFCTYLKERRNKCCDGKASTMTTDSLDWCEVEICSKNMFTGSMEAQSCPSMKCESLKLKLCISSQLFQEHFAYQFNDIIDALPFQEYMNPASGILNLAANLPDHMENPNLGPFLNISFAGLDDLMHPDFVTKLCYHSHDMVNILVHTTNSSVTSEQLTEIKDLVNKYNSHQEKPAEVVATGERGANEVEEKSSVLSEDNDESGSDQIKNGLPTDELQRPDSDSESDSGVSPRTESDGNGRACSSEETLETESCGTEWDIFRRQDVPKLLAYLKKHAKEIGYPYCVPENVVHPLFDETFYLDPFHKLKLKEEFNIEPWTFEQHLGEAVIVPAGCPYQFRKLKSCVNVVMNFVSPENTAKCINLIDEIRLLPAQHKARKKILEVKTMTLHSVSSAMKEINDLPVPAQGSDS